MKKLDFILEYTYITKMKLDTYLPYSLFKIVKNNISSRYACKYLLMYDYYYLI